MIGGRHEGASPRDVGPLRCEVSRVSLIVVAFVMVTTGVGIALWGLLS